MQMRKAYVAKKHYQFNVYVLEEATSVRQNEHELMIIFIIIIETMNEHYWISQCNQGVTINVKEYNYKELRPSEKQILSEWYFSFLHDSNALLIFESVRVYNVEF